MLQSVKNDLFGIARRLMQIRPNYHLLWNNRRQRYEVHMSALADALSLAFIVPFDALDERTLEYAYRTKIENLDELAREFDAENAEIERSAKRSLQDSAAELGRMLDFADKSIHKVVFNKQQRWF